MATDLISFLHAIKEYQDLSKHSQYERDVFNFENIGKAALIILEMRHLIVKIADENNWSYDDCGYKSEYCSDGFIDAQECLKNVSKILNEDLDVL